MTDKPRQLARRLVLQGLGLAAASSLFGQALHTPEAAGAAPAGSPAALPNRLKQGVVNARSMGALGDGSTDDTAALQRGLAAAQGGRFYVPAGQYLINVDYGRGGSLRPSSDTEIILDDGAQLYAMSTASQYSAMFLLSEVERVSIVGGTLVGERVGHPNGDGEQGHLVLLSGCADIFLSQMTLSDAWGDGVIVAYNDDARRQCERICLHRLVCRGNRRQGLSIVSATTVLVVDSSFSDTGGVAPGAGVDIEPDAPWSVRDVTLLRCTFARNSGSGLQITGLASPGRCRDIRVISCIAKNNGQSGVAVFESDGVYVDALLGGDNGAFGLYASTTRGFNVGSTSLWSNSRGDLYRDNATLEG